MAVPHRDLTEKYRTLRLQPDALYFSRNVRTLLNKFIKQGKRATALSHAYSAMRRYRLNTQRMRVHALLTRALRRLRTTVKVVYRRKAKKIHEVPVPAFRNRADAARFQSLYTVISGHAGKTLADRIHYELNDLTFKPKQSAAARAKSEHHASIYANRADFEMRWK
jgi:ribosomal protein S7